MEFIETLRQFRIGPFTIFDVVAAYLGVFIIALAFYKLFPKVSSYIPVSSWLWLTLPIGVMFHLVLRIDTPYMIMLLDPNDFYIAKIVLLFMLFMGFKGIKFNNKNLSQS